MSYLNLRLYQRNTQCLHIRKHRLAGFFVRLFVACAFAAQAWGLNFRQIGHKSRRVRQARMHAGRI